MVDHGSHGKPIPAAGQSPAAGTERLEGERVAKVLARAGVASRRDVERLIAEGRVAINGRLLETPAAKVGPNDILTVDGVVAADAEPTRLWRYHKPVGLMTTHKDPKGRPTVFENLPDGLPRVISIGRLDLNSEGLLLLTNDGALARALERPQTGLVRRYRARAYGAAEPAKLEALKAGTVIEGVAYGPIEARIDKAKSVRAGGLKEAANLWITVSLAEGKNREVRRVLESVGLKVNRLIRLSYGPFALGALERGAAEEVGPRVIRELLSEHIAKENLPTGDRTGGLLAPRDDALKPSRRSRGEGPRAPSPAKAAKAPEPLKRKAGWAKPKKRAVPSHAPRRHKDPKAADILSAAPAAGPRSDTRDATAASRVRAHGAAMSKRPGAPAKAASPAGRGTPTAKTPPKTGRPPGAGGSADRTAKPAGRPHPGKRR
jgi:23S rRNA pseudouridine2605 synthase